MPKACSLPGNLAGGIDFLPLVPFLVKVEFVTTSTWAQTTGAEVQLKRIVQVFGFYFVFVCLFFKKISQHHISGF